MSQTETECVVIFIVANESGVLGLYSSAERAIDSYVDCRDDGTFGEVFIDTAILDA